MTQTAICARVLKPSLIIMLATCRATVAGLITSCAAMALLLYPSATRAAISSSRGVTSLGAGVAAQGLPGAARGLRARAGCSMARSMAASGDIASPRAHSTAALPSSSLETAST